MPAQNIPDFYLRIHLCRPYYMFRHPKKNAVRNIFFKPFTQNVWWLCLNVSIVCWILLLVAIKAEDFYKNQQRYKLYTNAASETALITFAAVSQQGFPFTLLS